MTIPILQGMHAVAERYDGFVLDLWGVVHDGVTVFPGVIDALERPPRRIQEIGLPIQCPEASRNRRSATRRVWHYRGAAPRRHVLRRSDLAAPA